MEVKDKKIMAAITAAISAYLAEEQSLQAVMVGVPPPGAAGYVEIMCPQCGYLKRVALG